MSPRRLTLTAFLAASIFSLAACSADENEVVDIDVYRRRLLAIDRRDFFQTTRFVDRNGHLLAESAPNGYRTWVRHDDIPVWLRQAVVATEDKSFYSNAGVDTSAVARAAVRNAQAGRTVSGASTITMQLVRLVAFEPELRYEETLDRKVLEAQLAAELSERYTKDEILECYLNIAYFGNSTYGVQAAAREYFDSDVADLSVGQSALLAGLIQAPAALDPRLNPEGALSRRDVVIALMAEAGYLSAEEAAIVRDEPVVIAPQRTPPPRLAGHFVDHVSAELPGLLGPRIAARGGFTVTTTLDLELNDSLREVAEGHLAALPKRHNVGDAALVALRPGTGEILAMIGGLDYDEPKEGQVNVTISPRQPGSAFKPITYAAALESGWTPASLLWDIPLEFGAGDGTAYSPVNYDGRYHGPVRLRNALGNSLNAASVYLLAEVGVARVHALALEMGLELDLDPWNYGLSLTLGGSETTLVELTSAYGALAAEGRYTPPTGVLRVDGLSGGRLYSLEAPARRVVSREVAWLISDILSDAGARRPSFAAGGPLETSKPSAVKTGTTNDFRDNITVGYTRYLAIGVWCGNKDGQPMDDVLGITGAAPIWHDAMELVFASDRLRAMLGEGEPLTDGFPEPPGIVHVPVCDLSTLTANGDCRRYEEVFGAGMAFEDQGQVFDRIAVRTVPTGTGLAYCAIGSGVSSTGGQFFLLPPLDTSLAEQVANWAGTNGVRVAPPPCSATLGMAVPAP